MSYCWLHFGDWVKSDDTVSMRGNSENYLLEAEKLIPEEDREKKLFLILSQGWVYEGHAKEIFRILDELFHLEDAYILSPRFKWVICHCDDGECAVRSWAKE